MRLEAFSVRNYRSIRNAARIHVRSEVTVLIGPNNEGKTNLLRALNLAASTLDALAYAEEYGTLRLRAMKDSPRLAASGLPRYVRASGYEWEQDYPRDRQERYPSGETVVRLSFSLTAAERKEFYEEVEHHIGENLPVELAFGPQGLAVRIPVRRWGPQISTSTGKVALFLRDRMQIEYIPAVRTHEHASRVIDDVLSARLAEAEKDPEYLSALEVVRKAQQPVLDDLSTELTQTLQQFLPAVQGVRVEIPHRRRFERLRTASDVIVDDGVPTSLSSKGDGVISLAAIGLMRDAAKLPTGSSLVLAIEEPEAHLHPRAMHLLREAIRGLGASHQVIITTHSPIFAERLSTANVIVQGNTARAAENMADVRRCLGVQISDNLYSAEMVLLVEGPHDVTALSALLPAHSAGLKAALDDGRLVIRPVGGCSKLREHIYQLDHLVLSWHCLLDNDDDGKAARQAALDEGIAQSRQCTLTLLGKKKQSELEDWYLEDLYRSDIEAQYGDLLACAEYRQTRGKWSVRIRAAMEATGQPWAATEPRIKALVAESVAAAPDKALKRDAQVVLASLAATLEAQLS